jgi:hypothetical protein
MIVKFYVMFEDWNIDSKFNLLIVGLCFFISYKCFLKRKGTFMGYIVLSDNHFQLTRSILYVDSKFNLLIVCFAFVSPYHTNAFCNGRERSWDIFYLTITFNLREILSPTIWMILSEIMYACLRWQEASLSWFWWKICSYTVLTK